MAEQTKIITKRADELVEGDRDLGYGKVVVTVTLMNGDILVAYDTNATQTYRPDLLVSIEVAA